MDPGLSLMDSGLSLMDPGLRLMEPGLSLKADFMSLKANFMSLKADFMSFMAVGAEESAATLRRSGPAPGNPERLESLIEWVYPLKLLCY